MSMRTMEELRDTLCEELEEIARKGDLSAGDLETVHKLTDTIKNIDKIGMMEESGEYSQAGDWEIRGGGRYDDGNSYGGRHRDSRGRYSRDGGGMGGNQGGGYSERGRRRGYSRESGQTMMDYISNMMAEASTDREREIIQRFKQQIESL